MWSLLFLYGKDLKEIIEASEVKVGTYSQINEYMTMYDNPRSGSFTDLCPRSLKLNILKLKNTRSFEAKFHMEPPWDVRMKLFKCSGSHDQDGFQALYTVKIFKNPLHNQEADNLETWYTASGTQVLPNLFK